MRVGEFSLLRVRARWNSDFLWEFNEKIDIDRSAVVMDTSIVQLKSLSFGKFWITLANPRSRRESPRRGGGAAAVGGCKSFGASAQRSSVGYGGAACTALSLINASPSDEQIFPCSGYSCAFGLARG